jgi:8-oxo-dGTP pyrophosphatase MutT (NUDIX family)
MSYIRDIRTLVGHRPLVLTSAKVIILNPEGEILMQQNAVTGSWQIPGGYLEPGENLENTARREVNEETNLDLGDLTLWGVFSGPEFHWFMPNGDEVYNVTVAFVTTDYRGELRADGEEGEALTFAALKSLPEVLGPSVKHVLDAFAEYQGSSVKS